MDDLRSKDSSQDVADHAANAVDSENVEGIVNANEKLELGSKVAADGANDANDDAGPRSNIARRRSNRHQASNSPRAESNRAPFLLQTVIQQDPSDASDRSSQVGHEAGHDSAEVHAQCRAAVEAEPADPEEDGADDDVCDAVRAVRQAAVLVVAGALAQHDAVGEGAGSRGHVDGTAAGKVVVGQLGEPAVCVPGPVGDGVVDDGGPDEHEDDGGEHAAAVSDGTDGEGGTGVYVSWFSPFHVFISSHTRERRQNTLKEYSRNSRKHALVQAKQDIGQVGRAIRLSQRLHQAKLGEIAQKSISSSRKGE